MATNVKVTEVPAKALPQNAEAKATVAEAVNGRDAVLEPKLDGWRMLWKVGDDGVLRSYTRTGNEQTGKTPAIDAELAAALPSGTILDGEIVAFSVEADGRVVHRWGEVQKIMGSGTAKAARASGALTLVVFDMLAHGGHDARSLPYSQRRLLLEKLFANAGFGPRVILVPQLPATDESYDALLANGYEGGVVKWLDSPYASGLRGRGWFKIKATATVDVVIVGYKPGTPGSSFDGMVGAVEFGQHDASGTLVHRGRCSGMDWDVRKALTDDQDGYLGKVFEMAHMGVLPAHDGKPLGAFRHPQWKRLRTDKLAEQVTVHDA